MSGMSCAHCGRGGITGGAVIEGVLIPLCELDYGHETPWVRPFDCYRLVTVYGEKVGDRLNPVPF